MPTCPTCGNIQEESGPCRGFEVDFSCPYQFRPCLICDLPLGDFEISTSKEWHANCQICLYCSKEINLTVVTECQREGRPFSHRHCWIRRNEEELRKRPVEVTQGHLDYLNIYRLMLEPKVDLSTDTNQNDADIQFRGYRNLHEMTFEEVFLFGKRAEAVAAACLLIIADKKDKIKTERQERDVALIKDHEANRISDQRKKEIKNLEKRPDVKSLKALGISPEDALRMVQREKAIKAQMSVGLTREEAEASLDKGKESSNEPTGKENS